MKFTAVSSLLLLPLTAQALPTFSWGKQAKDIPELSLAEWESIHNPVSGAAAYAYSKAAEWVGNTEAEDSELTVWQLLNKDPERYSKITKLIGLIPPAKAVLDDRAGSLTFFAPENDGIPEPHHPHDGHGGHHGGHHDHDDEDEDEDEDAAIENLAANPSIANLYQHHIKTGDGHHHHDDDEKKRHRKEAFKFILSQVLAYHTLDSPKSAVDLANNNTVATSLVPHFGANDGQHLRLRVEKQVVPPSLKLNFYSTVTKPDVKAKNGYLHAVSKPLLPPPSILDAAFLFPSKFSTFTSAIQKVGGEGAIGYEFSRSESEKAKHPVFVGSPAVTAFVPTNEAFGKLPEKLIFFLFSPFGEQALRAVLQYHILPHHIVFSEHLHKVSGDHKKRGWIVDEVKTMMDNDPSFHVEFKLPTLFNKTEVDIVVDKSRVVPVPGAVKTTVTVNGVEASTIDVPALNGATHVIPEVLKPPHHHHDKHTGDLVESRWENWEDWLVEWAESS